MATIEEMAKTVERINKLTKQIKQTKPAEDYITSTIEGAAGFQRVFHALPRVRDDQPTQWEVEYEAFLDSLQEEEE